MKKIIVTRNPKYFDLQIPDVEVISTKTYLTDPLYAKMSNVRIFNLSNEYRYQSKGYYVSLLAEARGHKVLPSVKNMQDLKTPTIVRIISDELDDRIQHDLKDIKSDEFYLSIYFGQNVAKKYYKLSQEFHRLFQAPFLRARFIYNKKWHLQSVKAVAMNEIPENHKDALEQFAMDYFSKSRYHQPKGEKYKFDLAILHNPKESAPPSNKKALQNFTDAAEKQGFSVELITKEDYSRIGEFDALFIRETTSVNHHTYRFARRAQSEGMIVIDDPDSILRCTNKVYLAELLQNNKIPSPKTMIVHSDNRHHCIEELGLPVILKLPDAAFSQGVMKAKSDEELTESLDKMFRQSDLIIAQAYTPTDYDWRVGVLDEQPLYACKYYMAKGHWQIYNWSSKSRKEIEGGFECIPVEQVPQTVIASALKVTKLIGSGLYGVDVKEINEEPSIIEVNDNPSIDAGVEDLILGDQLYSTIISSIKKRLEMKLR